MAVDGPHIVEAKLLEEAARSDEAFDGTLHPLGGFGKTRSEDPAHETADIFLGAFVTSGRDQTAEVSRQRPDVGCDGHFVVVQDDQEIGADMSGVAKSLHGHAAGHGTVSDNGNDAVVLALLVARDGHAERGGDGGGTMPGAEGVVGTLRTLGISADAALDSQRGKPVAPSREQLVGVALMADVPHHGILFEVVDSAQGDAQFDHTQRRGQVATVGGDGLNDSPADLGHEGLELFHRERSQVGRIIHTGEQRALAPSYCIGHMMVPSESEEPQVG